MLVEVKPRPQKTRTLGPLARLLPVVLILWGFVGVYLIQLSLDRAGESKLREKTMAEMTYFPSGRFLNQAPIEFQSLAADFIWLRAIQYYGYHLMSDRKYEWLGHIFGIITALDSRFIGAYHFGAITLAWDAGKPYEAIDYLTEGMKANPLNWQLPFDAGFICNMLLRDYDRASCYFQTASKLPDAWFILPRWAAIAKAKAGDYQTARDMWSDILKGTQNKALKALVLRQLKNLNLTQGIDELQKAVERYQQDKRRLPADLGELVSSGYIDRIPVEPYGGQYYLKDGKVMTSTPPNQRE